MWWFFIFFFKIFFRAFLFCFGEFNCENDICKLDYRHCIVCLSFFSVRNYSIINHFPSAISNIYIMANRFMNIFCIFIYLHIGKYDLVKNHHHPHKMIDVWGGRTTDNFNLFISPSFVFSNLYKKRSVKRNVNLMKFHS